MGPGGCAEAGRGWARVLLLGVVEGLRGMAATATLVGWSPGDWAAWRVLGAALVLAGEGDG